MAKNIVLKDCILQFNEQFKSALEYSTIGFDAVILYPKCSCKHITNTFIHARFCGQLSSEVQPADQLQESVMYWMKPRIF